MYLKLSCSSCGKSLKVPEKLAGQRVRCPHCKNAVDVPDAPAAPAAVDWQSIVASSVSPPAAAGKAPAPSPAASQAPARLTGSINVSVLWSGLFGLGATAVFLPLLYPFRDFYFGAIFLKRGWVPWVETLLFFWAVAFLVLKWLKLRRQRDAMLFDLLPSEIAPEIDPANVDRFIAHVQSTAQKSEASLLVNRILRALEHFRVRRSNPEVASLLSSQSDIDANALSTSYTIVKVFIWAIPILGFIGTVLGIGQSVSSLSANISGAADMEALKGSLGQITSGLGVAFDTTLLALIMSIILRFPADALEKAENDLLNEVDDYCNENLVLRLRDGSQPGSASNLDPAQAAAIQKEILRISEESLRRIVEQFGRSLADLAQKSDAVQKSIDQSLQHASQAVQQSTRGVREHLSALQQGLGSLNSVLEKLGGERVVIEVQQPPRRGWLFFRRNNGDS